MMLKSLIHQIIHPILQMYRRFKFTKKFNAKIYPRVIIGSNCRLEGKNLLSEGVSIRNIFMGYGSYVANNSTLINVRIGRYTCIGPDVRTVIGTHPSSTFVSVHPAFFSLKNQIGFSYIKEQKFQERMSFSDNERCSILIGNDVWIGAGAKILEGVCVNDGAIVAAGALVTKNVPPYAVVGGVPAKILKYRFKENDDINYLLNLQWWNKGEEWIKANANYFDDIKKLRKVLKNA